MNGGLLSRVLLLSILQLIATNQDPSIYTANGPNGEKLQFLLLPDPLSPSGMKAVPLPDEPVENKTATTVETTTKTPQSTSRTRISPGTMPTISLEALMTAIESQRGNTVEVDLSKLNFDGIHFEPASQPAFKSEPRKTMSPMTPVDKVTSTQPTVKSTVVESDPVTVTQLATVSRVVTVPTVGNETRKSTVIQIETEATVPLKTTVHPGDSGVTEKTLKTEAEGETTVGDESQKTTVYPERTTVFDKLQKTTVYPVETTVVDEVNDDFENLKQGLVKMGVPASAEQEPAEKNVELREKIMESTTEATTTTTEIITTEMSTTQPTTTTPSTTTQTTTTPATTTGELKTKSPPSKFEMKKPQQKFGFRKSTTTQNPLTIPKWIAPKEMIEMGDFLIPRDRTTVEPTIPSSKPILMESSIEERSIEESTTKQSLINSNIENWRRMTPVFISRVKQNIDALSMTSGTKEMPIERETLSPSWISPTTRHPSIIVEPLDPSSKFLDRQVNAMMKQLDAELLEEKKTTISSDKEVTTSAIVEELRKAFFPPQVEATEDEMKAIMEAAAGLPSTTQQPLAPTTSAHIRRTHVNLDQAQDRTQKPIEMNLNAKSDALNTFERFQIGDEEEELLKFLDRNPVDIFAASIDQQTTQEIRRTSSSTTSSPTPSTTSPPLPLPTRTASTTITQRFVKPKLTMKKRSMMERAVRGVQNTGPPRQRKDGKIGGTMHVKRLRKRKFVRKARWLRRRDRKTPTLAKNSNPIRRYRRNRRRRVSLKREQPKMSDVITRVLTRDRQVRGVDGDTKGEQRSFVKKESSQNFVNLPPKPEKHQRQKYRKTIQTNSQFTTIFPPYATNYAHSTIPNRSATISQFRRRSTTPKPIYAPITDAQMGPRPQLPPAVLETIANNKANQANQGNEFPRQTLTDIFNEAIEYVFDTKKEKGDKRKKPQIRQLSHLESIPDSNVRWKAPTQTATKLLGLGQKLLTSATSLQQTFDHTPKEVGLSKLSIRRQDGRKTMTNVERRKRITSKQIQTENQRTVRPKTPVELEMEELSRNIAMLGKVETTEIEKNSINVITTGEDQPVYIDSRFRR